jgi:hypothetical protein
MSRKSTLTGLKLTERFPWMKKAAIITGALALTGGAAGLSYYAWDQSGNSAETAPMANNFQETQPTTLPESKPMAEAQKPMAYPTVKPRFEGIPEAKKNAVDASAKKPSKKIAKKSGKKGKHKLSKASKHGKSKWAKKHGKGKKKVAKHGKSHKKVAHKKKAARSVAGH